MAEASGPVIAARGGKRLIRERLDDGVHAALGRP